jgi:hypothetical protein
MMMLRSLTAADQYGRSPPPQRVPPPPIQEILAASADVRRRFNPDDPPARAGHQIRIVAISVVCVAVSVGVGSSSHPVLDLIRFGTEALFRARMFPGVFPASLGR